MELPEAGSHILLWSDDSPSSDVILATFVQGGLRRGDLVAIVWPNLEREDLHRLCEAAGVPLPDHIVRGDVAVLSAEQHTPRDVQDENSVASLFDELSDLVRHRRKSGLSFIGRIAPFLFERGDVPRAEMVEEAVRARQGTGRVLCPYRPRALALAQMTGAGSLVRSHSHTITALGQGRFLMEKVGRGPGP